MPEYSLNTVVRHALTGEEGRIVRIVNASRILRRVGADHEPAYIVSLPAGQFAKAREALWFPSEVASTEKSEEGDGRSAADRTPQLCWVCGKAVVSEERRLDSLGNPVHIACHESESIPIDIQPA